MTGIAHVVPIESADVSQSPAGLLCRCGLFWKALLGLMIFDLLGFARNFSKLHQRVAQWPVAPYRRIRVQQACQAVNHACVWYPKRVLCLQRSAVLTCLLRSGGIFSKMVLGVQSLPFKAHAWTEVDGLVVNERRDVQQIYQVWDRF